MREYSAQLSVSVPQTLKRAGGYLPEYHSIYTPQEWEAQHPHSSEQWESKWGELLAVIHLSPIL